MTSEQSAGATMHGATDFPGRFHPAAYHLELDSHDADHYEGIIENGTLSIQPGDLDDAFIEMSRWISADRGSYLTRKDMDGGLPPYDDPSETLLAIEVGYQDGIAYQIQEQGGTVSIVAGADTLEDLGDWR